MDSFRFTLEQLRLMSKFYLVFKWIFFSIQVWELKIKF